MCDEEFSLHLYIFRIPGEHRYTLTFEYTDTRIYKHAERHLSDNSLISLKAEK